MSWDKRELTSLTLNDNGTLSFAYNSSGLRTQKVYRNGDTVTVHNYILDGTSIISETVTENGVEEYTLYYLYEGSLIIGFIYNDIYYYFQNNLQGDVVRILGPSGDVITEYTYDAWGKVVSVTSSLADTIGAINPFRYRSYYYDTETGFYYLQSRYYDPSVGRFLNADGAYDTNQGILGYNMYVYCLNRLVNMSDIDGKCGRFLGFLWMIDCKKVTCPTSENYIKPKKEPIGTYNKDKGYVYVVTEEEVSDFTKELEDSAVVIVDQRTASDPNMKASDPNMKIMDSYKITKRKHQKDIARLMIDYNVANPVSPAWDRSLDSLVFEWELHNNIYFAGLFHANTKDCDFNNNDEGKGYWDFFVERVLK